MKVQFAVLAALILVVTIPGAGLGQDLFAEAGHAIGHSRWVVIRLLPLIQIALEADDIVLVESIDHPAKSLAMKIDGKAVATDCEVTESKNTDFTIASESKDSKWASGTTTTSTTYWASCQFDSGTAGKAASASAVLVQLAMTNGTTKPHQLGSKELRKFQNLNK